MFVVEGSVGGLLSWLGFTDHFVSKCSNALLLRLDLKAFTGRAITNQWVFVFDSVKYSIDLIPSS